MSNPVTITITGALDFDLIASISKGLDPARWVIFDLTEATGGSSTHIAACVQVAIVTGKPVTVRGCSERFAVALGQMRLGHLVKFQDAPRRRERVCCV